MKLKTLVATMALTCASGVALAQDYNFEVGVNYTDVDYDAGGNDDFLVSTESTTSRKSVQATIR